MSSPTTVVYCFDKGYAPYAAVSTFSLISNSTSALEIVWIVPQEDEAGIAPVLRAVEQKTGQSIRLIAVPSNQFDDWKLVSYISRAGYFRLLIPSLIAESRAIYIDADTLVLSDLAPLFSMDMGDHLIAGVPDPGAGTSKVQRIDGDPYLNSGMLLMNLDALRDDGFLEKARALYWEHEQDLVFIDQCLINKYAEGRKRVIDSGWNRLILSYTLTDASFDELLREERPSVLHFLTSIKPWQRCCTPGIFDFWWRYADELGIEGLKPQPITAATTNHALSVVHWLEANGRARDASLLKDKIIADLRVQASVH